MLVAYVAACTPQRDALWGADAWEHHRVLKALTRDLNHPGNPTYAIDVPSVRYSPYFVLQATLARWIGIDPYLSLSAAATLNTALLVLAIWALLVSFDEQRSATAVLLAVVGLYWVTPGYANSLALADLPWLQVNPSAWSLACSVLCWAIFKRSIERGGPAFWTTLLITLLLAICVLDHVMTALFGVLGLGVIAITRNGKRRWLSIASVLMMTLVAFGIDTMWPWFRLVDAVGWGADREYWFNASVLRSALTEWCVPGYLCGLAALTRLDRDLVRCSLLGGAIATLLGISSFVTRSPATARLPILSTLFFAIATGVFLQRTGAMSLRTWRERLKGLQTDRRVTAETALVVVVLLVMAYGLIPQGLAVFREPWLGQTYVARLLRLSDDQEHLKEKYDRLLTGVGTDDVVLSDTLTSWPVPSSNGKIVAALHYELFVTDQASRTADVMRFFSRTESEANRLALLDKYRVRWILLNRRLLDAEVFERLLDAGSVAQSEKDLFLIDARAWRANRSGRATASRNRDGVSRADARNNR
jgi:hypothetical protein